MFLLHFSRFKTFLFLDIQKLKYAAAYFAYTQARPWEQSAAYQTSSPNIDIDICLYTYSLLRAVAV